MSNNSGTEAELASENGPDETESDGEIIGIDLGTTNSAAAVVTGGGLPEMIQNKEGERTTPSVVARNDGQQLVGKDAKMQRVSNSENTVSSVKREMGERARFYLEEKEYTPEQISAMILQKIAGDASTQLGEEITRAVITVPAYFSDDQRKATRQAGEIAGLEVERIINEPTAAAIAFGVDEPSARDDSRKILVFDLGGGTFDVSILTLRNSTFQVEVTRGDTELGGDDWDDRLVQWVVEKFRAEHGIDLTDDRQALQRIRDKVQEVKHTLSRRAEATLNIPFIYASDGDNYHIEYKISRTKFEELTEELVRQTREPVELALKDAILDPEDLDDVILIGGATRMPMIQRQVREITGIEPRDDVNPDEAVARGAAVQADMFQQATPEHVLVDVTPLSLGVEVTGGLFEPIIDRNTTIPTRQTKTFTTAEDGQETVVINVFQGERAVAEENVFLGDFELTGIPSAEAGEAKVDVTFDIDVDGIVSVSAVEQVSGEAADVQIQGGVGLSDEEVERMQQEAAAHIDEDMRQQNEIEARNRLELSVSEAEALVEGHAEKIPEQVVDELTRTLEKAQRVLANYEQSDSPIDDLETAHDRFEQILAEVYENYLQDGMRQQSVQQETEHTPGLDSPERGTDTHTDTSEAASRSDSDI